MKSIDQKTGDENDSSVDSQPDDDGVVSLADIEEHSQFVQEYMRRLLKENSPPMAADEQQPVPASQSYASAPVNPERPPSRETLPASLNRDTAVSGDVVKPPASSDLECDDNRPRRPPANPREERELLSRMRRVANESTTSTLAEYDLRIGRTTLLKTTVAMFLLVASFALFASASSGRVALFFPGAGCWLAALFFSLPLFRHLKSN
jgi:hypothetical protein